MKKIILASMIGLFSTVSFAAAIKPVACKDFPMIQVKQSVQQIAPEMKWEDTSCKIVATKTVFPKKVGTGKIEFNPAMQISVYENGQLKVMCVPGLVCKLW